MEKNWVLNHRALVKNKLEPFKRKLADQAINFEACLTDQALCAMMLL